LSTDPEKYGNLSALLLEFKTSTDSGTTRAKSKYLGLIFPEEKSVFHLQGELIPVLQTGANS